MNELHDHGIHTEDSDIRAHVGVLAQTIFVFRTKEGVRLLNTGKYNHRPAGQPGVVGPTAMGVAVPLEDFLDMRTISCKGWPQWDNWTPELPTGEKGRLAVSVVVGQLGFGRFPLWVTASESEDRNIQIKGTDIVVCAKQKIQVKCDFRAGPKTIPGCTGNIYLQIAERNPLKQY